MQGTIPNLIQEQQEDILEQQVNFKPTSPDYTGARLSAEPIPNPDGKEEAEEGANVSESGKGDDDSPEDEDEEQQQESEKQQESEEKLADFAEHQQDGEKLLDLTAQDNSAIGENEKRVKPPTQEEAEVILGEFFRIVDTYCEKKDNKAWKKRFVDYWADGRSINLEPFKVLG